jgi:hypothetical protein
MTVRQRLHLLAYLGYYVGDITDNWTAECRVACKAFQSDFQGIAADGFGGPETDKALRHAVAYDMFMAEKIPDNDADFWATIPNFTKAEFACKCGQYHAPYCDGYPHEIQPLLVRIAQRARDHFGKPIDIVSGLRCDQHNADSGGVWNSQHKYGEAADIRVRGVSQKTVLDWFLTQPDVRYAYAIDGSENVHYDIQPVGR